MMIDKQIYKIFIIKNINIELIIFLLLIIPIFANNIFHTLRKLNGGTVIEMNMAFTGLGEQNIFVNCLPRGNPSLVFINSILQDLNNGVYNIQTISNNNVTLIWDITLTNCSYMFYQLTNIEEIKFIKFDTTSVVDMRSMFMHCESLKVLNISIFNTKNVLTFEKMFSFCYILPIIDVSNFNTENAYDMNNMFSQCHGITSLNISHFNTSHVTLMHSMFSNSINLVTLDLSNLYVKNVDSRNIFRNCNKLKYIKLINYKEQDIFGGLSQEKIICTNNFNEMRNMITSFSSNTINDCSIYPLANYPQVILITIDNKGYQNIFSNEFSFINNIAKIFINGEEQTISDDGNYQLSEFINNITFFWKRYPLNETRKMFYGLTNIVELNFITFDTSFVTHMGQMFEGCSNLKFLNISSLDFSNVKYSFSMFKDCYLLDSLDLSNFNSSINTDFSQMFKGCNSLKSINLSYSITENIETMEECFKDCNNLEILDLSYFDTSRITTFNNIFYNCEKLEFINLYFYTGIDIFESLIQNKSICTDNYERLKNIAPSLEINTEVDCLIYPFNNNMTYIPSSIKSKDKLIKFARKLIRDNETYLINGESFSLLIKPINEYVEESMINIDFSKCETILKGIYPSYEFRVLQVNIKDNAPKSLIEQVEYIIFNQNGKEIDIFPCKNVDFYAEYKITNVSKLNLEKIIYFRNLGVDIFNIKDNFFNDICYPYSDNDSSSDMILNDRISDIYQNYSICEKGCEYESFNIDKMAFNCNCKLKKDISLSFVVQEGNLETYIKLDFLNANFGVIKCYNLVFTFVGKVNNIGFWLFGVILISHFPIYIFHFIYGINPVDNYIKSEMDRKGYNIINTIENNKEIKKSLSFTKETSNRQFKEKKNQKSKFLKTKKSKFCKAKINNNSHPPKKGKHLESNIEDLNNANQNIENNHKKNILKIFENEDEKLEYRSFSYNYKIEKKNYNNKNNLRINLGTNSEFKKKIKKIPKRNSLFINNLTYELNSNETFSVVNTNSPSIKEDNKSYKINNEISLILINADNEKYFPINSKYILNNYDFEEAINYDERKLWRIFLIYIYAKNNLLNIIFFNPPLELKPLRICIFIFSFACDFALNALFYFTDNISDIYHYNGVHKILFTLINNITISLISTIVSFLLLTFFNSLTQSTDKIKKVFNEQDILLKSDDKYKVSMQKKLEIKDKIKNILKCLKIKIIFFIIFELLLTLFFLYYTIAFCHVYKSTQISWLLDGISSYVISFLVSFVISFICSIIYKIAIKYKIKILYKIILFLYE